MKQFNFRLFLRPTAVGKIIIDRLTSEGVDRQADARRWIELGYMCEQAGFRVDGSTLFQAGRPAAEQPAPGQVAVQSTAVAALSAPAAVSHPGQQAGPAVPATAESRPFASTSLGLSPSPPAAVPRPVTPSEASATMDSQLTSNLRNLAH